MTWNAAAYYLWPTVWVGSAPPTSGEHVDVSTISEEVYRTILDVGICAKVLREGMFFFDFSGWRKGEPVSDLDAFEFDEAAKVTIQRVAVLNAHLACLYTSLSRRQLYCRDKMVVVPSQLITMESLDETGWTLTDKRLSALLRSRYHSSYAADMPTIADWRLAGRHLLVVQIETVDESFRLLGSILDHASSDLLLITDLHLRSCKAYEDYNYDLCLVTGWAATEKLLQALWTRYVDKNRRREMDGAAMTFINRARREKLTDGRDFTASVVSEILSLMEYLPFDLYEDLSRVRQARNRWIHGLEPVSREMGELSAKVTQRMLTLVEGIDLDLPLVTSGFG